jgi:uncharacterized protein
VIGVDTNMLVYAHRRDSVWHERAAGCLRRLAEGTAPWFIPWPCIHEFLAVATHPRLYSPPSGIEAALQQVDYWMQSPTLLIEGESAAHWATLKAAALSAQLSGPIVHDARVAAICLDHGVEEFWTADRDFSRFPGLRTVNPLLA